MNQSQIEQIIAKLPELAEQIIARAWLEIYLSSFFVFLFLLVGFVLLVLSLKNKDNDSAFIQLILSIVSFLFGLFLGMVVIYSIIVINQMPYSYIYEKLIGK